MTVADDYFARVRPLLGRGLGDHVVAVEETALASIAIELLASCMLEHVVAPDPTPIARHAAWKQLPLRTTPAPADATIRARRGPPAIAWGDREVTMTVDPADPLAWFDVSYHVARGVRDALLGRTAWPTRTPAQPFDPRGIAVDLRGRHVMVIGCGSLGSEAVRMLATSGARFTLVDDARVTVFNLARQWYGAADVGRRKVDALCDRVAARAWPIRLDVDALPAFATALVADPPDLVVLATGTHHHAMLAEHLWRAGIPHVAACCYPQARYFEVGIVSPRERTPCLHCFRGHLYRGPADTPPVADEIAAFLYRDDASHARYADLVAEPASQIETLRAAHVLARCVVELLAPRRTPWFARVLAEATTCLLGGNVAGACGITEPGQVLRLGTGDIVGAADVVRCDVCGRTMEVALRDELPAIPDDADAALR